MVYILYSIVEPYGKEALEEIDFWVETIAQFNGQNIYGPNHQHSSWLLRCQFYRLWRVYSGTW